MTDPHKYQIHTVDAYRAKTIKYLETKHNLNLDDATALTEKIIKENLVDPKIHVYHRPFGEDTHEDQISYLDLVNNVYNHRRIMVPSGTVYENPKIRLSYIAKQLQIWLKERAIIKKQSFVERMKGNDELANELKDAQLIIKRKANSVSGLFASFSHLRCKSTHYTLTSTTAMATSIANASNERFLAGNYHFRKPSVAIDYMVSVLANTDYDRFTTVLSKYNLNLIKPDDLYKIVKECTDLYFASSKFRSVASFIYSLSDLEATIIAYTGSLYNIRLFNGDFIFNFINSISEATPGESTIKDFDDYVEFMSNVPEDIRSAIHHIEFENMKGVQNGYVKTGDDDKDHKIDINIVRSIKAKTLKFQENMEYYKELTDIILHTDVMPPDPAYLPTMSRRVVVLSDTDSTCFTSEEWVDWYSNKVERFVFPEAMGVMAIVGTLAIRALSFHLLQYSRLMGVGEENERRLAMKNEFSWSVFIRAANAAKHYIADTMAIEGNILPKSLREVKGANLKGVGNSPTVLNKLYHMSDMFMNRIITDYNNPVNITSDIKEFVDLYKELKVELLEQVYRGDTSVLKTLTVKPPENYSNHDPYKSNCRYLLIWNSLFSDLYNAEYDEIFVKISLKVEKARHLEIFLDELKSVVGEAKVEEGREVLRRLNRTSLSVFYVPKKYLDNNKLPPILKKWLNAEVLLEKTLKPVSIFLEALGYFMIDIKI